MPQKKPINFSPVANTEITDLTILRGLFAIWVFSYHVNLHAQFPIWIFGNILRHGYLGVDGFFLLSGLMLALIHKEFAVTLVTVLRFWGRRLARIYPVHLATIGILAVLLAAGMAAGFSPQDPDRFSMIGLLQNLVLAQGWGIGPHWAWNYPSWSISCEWAGYILFPFVYFMMCKCDNMVVGQFAIICFPVLGLIAFWTHHGLNVTYEDALPRFGIEFIWGMCTARMIPLFADELPTAFLVPFGFGITLIGTMIGFDDFAVFGLWIAIMCLTMNKDAERPPIFKKINFLRPLGLISYSFYMSFAIAEMLLAALFRHLGWDPASERIAYTLGMVALTIAIAIAVHVTVEQPSRRLAERWLTPKPVEEEILPPLKPMGKIKRPKARVQE
jgi:peptidoglycan/LPS O-acetylase OafA/YrhL